MADIRPTYVGPREPLMNIRTFLRGGYAELDEPTTIISGTTRLGVWLPEAWAPDPRSAHPDVARLSGERLVPPAAGPALEGKHARTGSGGQTEAPASRAGRVTVGARPARSSVQSMLDRANQEGR